MKKKMWIAGALLGVVLLIVVAVIAVASPFNSRKVKTATVARKNLDLTISASGKVAADKKTNVGTTTGGKVSAVYVKEGDLVAVGASLISFESEDLSIAVEQSSINVSIAELNEENAQAGVQLAQNNLSKTKAGATSAQLGVSSATVSQAHAGVDASNQAVTDIKELNASGLSMAGKSVEQAQAAFDGADQAVDDAKAQWDEAKAVPLTDIQILTYEGYYHTAQANYESARLALDSANLAYANIQKLNTQALNTAKGQASTAQKGYDLAKAQYNLANSGVTSYDIGVLDSQLKMAKSQYNVTKKQTQLAQLSQQSAENQLDKATVTAPIAGLVASINTRQGEIVSPAMPGVPGALPLAVIIDVPSLRFAATVDETDVTKVKAGQKVEVTLDAYEKKKFPGVVEKVGFTTVATEGGATAYAGMIAFTDNDIAGLREGMNGDVDVVVGMVKNTLSVPDSAVLAEKGKSYVFVINEDNTLEKKEVQLGDSFDGFLEIKDGVEEGQRIVRTELKYLKDGEKVEW